MEDLGSIDALEEILTQAVKLGSVATATSVCILVAQAIAVIGGLVGGVDGMLVFFVLMLVLQQLHQRYAEVQNTRGILGASMGVLLLGGVLFALLALEIGLEVPGFIPSGGEYQHVARYADYIVVPLLITAGIAGIICYRTAKSLVELTENLR